jgi:hypothetical protein
MAVVRYLLKREPRPPDPTGVTAEQIKDIVAKYLIAHPEQRNTVASSLVGWAILNAWQCKPDR